MTQRMYARICARISSQAKLIFYVVLFIQNMRNKIMF